MEFKKESAWERARLTGHACHWTFELEKILPGLWVWRVYRGHEGIVSMPASGRCRSRASAVAILESHARREPDLSQNFVSGQLTYS